ncbi:MAG TPA: hypothetical protein PKM88_16705, partial [bacterium]|nr:hypothetical protein [bacterium]
YPAGRVYARGTRSHRMMIAETGRFTPPDTGERQALLLRHVDGTPLSDPLLRQYAGWMNDYVARRVARAYRVNDDTLFILLCRDLRELAQRPPVAIDLQAAPMPWQPAAVRAALTELRAELDRWEQGGPELWRNRATGAAGGFICAFLVAEWRSLQAGAPAAEADWRAGMAEQFPYLRAQLAAAV